MTTAEFLNALFADAVSPERRIAIFTMPTRPTAFFATAEEAAQCGLKRTGSLDVYFGVEGIPGRHSGIPGHSGGIPGHSGTHDLSLFLISS